MKIQVNDQTIFEVEEIHKQALAYFVNQYQLEKEMTDMIRWTIQSYCESSIENMKKEWLPKLFKRVKSIPTDTEELLKLIFSQPDYRSKYHRECLEKAEKEAQFKVE